MILTTVVIGLVAFLVLLVFAIARNSTWREIAYEKMKEEMAEDGIESLITGEEKLMKEEQMRGESERTLRVARPVNMAGVIYGVIVGLVLLFVGIYLWTPSQVREYRVQMDSGIYQVRGIVQYGRDFTAYQSVDGKEAIETCNEMNAELMKDRGGVLRNGKVAWRQ
jgi:hypothetical protein